MSAWRLGAWEAGAWRDGSWRGMITGTGVNVTVVFNARIRQQGMYRPNYILQDLGDGTFNVTEYVSMARDKVDSVHKERYEFS